MSIFVNFIFVHNNVRNSRVLPANHVLYEFLFALSLVRNIEKRWRNRNVRVHYISTVNRHVCRITVVHDNTLYNTFVQYIHVQHVLLKDLTESAIFLR